MEKKFKYNMRSSISVLNRIAARFFYPAVGFVVLLAALFLLVQSCMQSNSESITLPNLFFSCVSITLSTFLFYLSKIVYRFEARKFRLSEEGIEIKDLGYAKYNWNDLWRIAVMHFGATASRDSSFTVICCFLREPETHYKKRMLDYFYGVTHAEHIVIVEHCDDVMDEFLEKYPGKIFDYRKDQIT